MKLRWLVALGVLASTLAFGQEHAIGDSVLVSHASGEYSTDLWLRAGARRAGEVLEFRFSGTDYFLPLRRPLHLTAISGEERTYDIEIRVSGGDTTRESVRLAYKIDKRAPTPPIVSLASGTYIDEARIQVVAEDGARVEYTLDRPLTFEPQPWPGSVLVLEAENAAREVVLRARAVDSAGNRSEPTVRTYSLVPASAIDSGLEIVSPIPGRYDNKQLLFVRTPPSWETFYAVDGDDPVESGDRYTEPVLIEGAGEQTVAVASRDPEGEWHRQQVAFAQGIASLLDVESGAYDRELTLSLPGVASGGTYWFRIDGDRQRVFDQPVRLAPQPGVFRVVSFEIGTEADESQYRYLFLLEGRDPGIPEIVLEQVGPRVRMSASGRPGASIWYEVDSGARLYTGPTEFSVPNNSAGEFAVDAYTVLSSGVAGERVAESIFYDTEAPRAPSVSVSQVATGVRITIEDDGGGDVRYEFEPRPVGINSPRLIDGSVLESPFGLSIRTTLVARSFDDAGNVSAGSVSQAIVVDRLPPPTPTITVAGGEVSLSGEGLLLFHVDPPQDINAEPSSDFEGYSVYREAIPLGGQTNRRIEYQITALSVDENLNASPPVSEAVVINRRTPVVPQPAGISDGGVYNVPSLTVGFRDVDPDLELYYTLTTDGSEPPTPTLDSSSYSGPFQVDAEAGVETTIALKVLPYYPTSGRRGTIAQYRVTVDRDPPELPAIVGAEDGAVLSRSPLIELQADSETDTVFYAVATASDGSVDALGASGRIYSSPFELTTPAGNEVRYLLDVAVRDVAGNVRRMESPIRFVVDRQPPDPPSYEILSGSSDSLSFGTAVSLRLSSPATVYYETTSDGRVPPIPGASSPRFNEDIRFEGVTGAVVQYNLAAIAIDEAGNRSDLLELLGLTIDLEPPGEASEPTLRMESDSRAQMGWEVPPGLDLLFRLGEGNEYQRYSEPVEIELPDAGEALTIEYLYVDDAGNRGPVGTTVVSQRAEPSPPALAGVQDGETYGEAITIFDTLEQGIVRYEIAETPTLPAPVTRFSPSLDEPLRIDVAEGRSVTYRIRARRFVGDRVSDVATLVFGIDRRPPPPPELVGIEPGAYYENEQTVALTAEEGSIYVALRRNAPGSSVAGVGELEFQRYTSPIRLGAEEGDLASYTVFAYTEDDSGNRSEPLESWQVFIDREVIYVAPDGDDSGDGSRNSPFASIDRAVEYARSSQRGTIFLASGNYTVSQPVRFEETLSLVGGYDRESWQRTGEGRTRIDRAESTSDTVAMFIVDAGQSLNISGLDIVESKGFWQTIVRSEDGAVSVSDVTMDLAGRTKAVTSYGGSLQIAGTDIGMRRTSAAVVIDLRDAEAEIVGLTVALADLVSSFDALRLLDSRVLIRDSTLAMQAGWMMRGIAATGGETTIVDVDLVIESAREGVTGVSITEGSLTAEDLSIRATDASYVLGLRVEGGSGFIDRGSVSIAEAQGATGFAVRDADFTLSGTELTLEAISQFSYGISSQGAVLRAYGPVLSVEAEGEAFLVVLDDSTAEIRHMSAEVGGSPRIAGGINVSGSGRLSLINSILIGSGAGTAVAIEDSVAEAEVAADNFSGWQEIWRYRGRSFANVNDLNRHYRDLLILGRIDSFVPNLSASRSELFEEFPRLRSSAPVIDQGKEIAGEPMIDRDEQPLPRPGSRRDIGADEYYPTTR